MSDSPFIRLLTETLGREEARRAWDALEGTPSVSVRYHPFKPAPGRPDGVPVPWNALGRTLAQRPLFTLDPLLHAGSYYVQDASAMFVGHLFDAFFDETAEERPVRVLDLCAAPGGKTTDLAARLRGRFGDRFVLVANEPLRARASVLAGNVDVWGDPNVLVTRCDPSAFAALPAFFDAVVTDVPCSGEGMFRKDAQAREEWSPEAVALCAARQRRILADVWPALRPGGLLVYATCTFNHFENDDNVAWAASTLGADILTPLASPDAPGVLQTRNGFQLVPGRVDGEGQYAAALRRKEGAGETRLKPPRTASRPVTVPDWERLVPAGCRLWEEGSGLRAVPEAVAACAGALQALRPLRLGCAAGILKGRDFVPDPALALSFLRPASEAIPSWETDRSEALRFLHGDSFALPEGAPRGFLRLTYAGLGLGYVKNLGNRCNNLHPAARRIRMDLNESL